MVSRDRNPENFFAFQKFRDDVRTKMTKKKLFDELLLPSQGYHVSDIGVVDLTHFLYYWLVLISN